MKKKKILVKGPALTRSGYGEQTRFALRALRDYQEFFDIYLEPLNWGKTGWIADDSEERVWMDTLVGKTIAYRQSQGEFDISLQVTIPQEWEILAKTNIGYTAGTETTKISGEWVEKSNLMNKIITVSEHTKHAFENSSYQATNSQTGETVPDYRCTTELQTINFSTREVEPEEMDLNLEFDFNFLIISQWSVRKNLENTIKWFIDEFKDKEVGLVVKANFANNSIIDSERTRRTLKNLIDDSKDHRKCKVYLLHGDLTDGQMTSLYRNSKIKALINLAHGEGFGLPMFEAVQNELPVIAPDWSGHLDFLYAPTTIKQKGKTKVKNRAHFAKVDYNLQPIQESAVWHPVLIKESMWCYPNKVSYGKALKDVLHNYGKYKKMAEQLKKHVDVEFAPEKLHREFAEACYGQKLELEEADYVFVSDFFADQYTGGAELSLESLIKEVAVNQKQSVVKLQSSEISEKNLNFYKDCKWIFGNYTQINPTLIDKISQSTLNYSVVEFDYKFCKYRNLELHNLMEGEDCSCHTSTHGDMIETFLSNANNVFFMSEKQKEIHLKRLKTLKPKSTHVLSSIFEDSVLDTIKALRNEAKDKKEDYWVIPTGQLWVKGADAAKKWCAENNHKFIELQNLSYLDALKTLAAAKGLCFLPAGAATCPRLVIEAKLLDCELNINDNVQHAKESWFDTDNLQKIETYLRSVPTNFWNLVGTNEQHNTDAVGG